MELKEINFVNFRNLQDNNTSFSPGFNLFYGKNGQGKTSILEAIFFAATGRSFRTKKVQELIKYSKDKCGTFLSYKDRTTDKSIAVKFSQSKKEYNFNGKKISHSEFYGKVNVVSFIPEDIELITGTPGVRRRFFDEEISQSNQEYYNNLRDFNKVLKIRNSYLKERKHSDELFKVYEGEFLRLASLIIKKRLEYVKSISIILNLNYRKLFDNKKELGVLYHSEVPYGKKESLESIREKLEIALKEQRGNELRYGFTQIGPQRDEFQFLLNGKEAKSFSSQGEKKSVIFSLKLSEIDMIFKERSENPIFLIDDISSYFDEIRKDSILSYLKKRGIQLFISSTTKLDVPCKEFKIDDGILVETRESNGTRDE